MLFKFIFGLTAEVGGMIWKLLYGIGIPLEGVETCQQTSASRKFPN
jgi:hypothetical protein